MPALSSNAGPSQFDTPQFHPEFGYLAPTVRFRRKFTLIIEGAACGILVGAIAMFFATMEREEKALAMLATPMLVTPVSSAATPSSVPTSSTPAVTASMPATSGPVAAAPATSTPTVSKPGSSTPASSTSTPPQTAAVRGFAPVRFVPESIALPAVVPRLSSVRDVTPPAATVSVPAFVAAPPPMVAAAPESAPEANAVVAKPKKKIARSPKPERTARQIPPEPEPRSAFASPFRSQGSGFLRPLFGFGF